MKPRSQEIGASMSLVAGLLLLALSSVARPALAQEACPIPAGVTPLADPQVTAQQVEDGSATLKEFALAVREQYRALSREIATFEGEAYFGCLIRRDGSAYRSGSTFLVSLAPDGSVLVHSTAMRLSGRKLNPLIFGAILRALGARGFPDLIAAAYSEGGSFDVPHIPGASGYAAVYLSPGLGVPVILLAGFDLNETHLAEEALDYGDPAITASDVVDRETLKAFVAEAAHYLLELGETGGRNAIWGAKHAMRDPNGPWRHGSVYLYVLDLASNLIMFHGAFPDRYEFLPLSVTVRDAVTGELVLPQLIEAAKSSSEGGFVRYFFDDPADDNDSADIPKVGYARVFTGSFREPGGGFSQGEFVVGSGFYLSSPNVVAARQNKVIETVLPQVMRAMTASTVDAVSGRIQQANTGAAPAKAFRLGGASTLWDILLANGQALGNGTFDSGRLLAGSSFTLPLNAAGGAGNSPREGLTLWGSADYRDISGGKAQTVDYDGDVASANIGVDTRLNANLLAGMSVGLARGTVDYVDTETVTGELTSTLTSINPYVGWHSDGGVSLWAAAGHGWGEVEIEESTGRQASDLTQQMAAAGASMSLMSSDQLLEGGTTSLRLKGETAFTRADLDDSGTFDGTKLYTRRQRLMFEGIHVRQLASGATLAPSLEFGMRYDGGDGETGRSLELGGGLRHTNRATGLTLEGRARGVLEHEGDYGEWGVSGMVALDPGVSGLGLALSVQPSWGYTARGAQHGVQQIWTTGEPWGAPPTDRGAGRVDARIAYGIGTTWGGAGVLTPYTRLSLSGASDRYLSLGGRFDLGTWARMSLGMHRRSAFGETDHGVMLRCDLNW